MTDTERRLAAALHEEACRINPGHLDWTNCAGDGPCADDAAALLPVVAEIEAEAKAEAVTSMAHLFRDMAQETLARREVIQLLDLRADSYCVKGSDDDE